MHTQLHVRPSIAAMPLPQTIPCPNCGQLPIGVPHREDCFPAFQRALIAAYPSLTNVVTMEEAGAIERIFQFWTGIIHALRHVPAIAEDCIERRWYEVSAYVERMLARYAQANTAAS